MDTDRTAEPDTGDEQIAADATLLATTAALLETAVRTGLRDPLQEAATGLDDATLQRLLAAAVKLFARRLENGELSDAFAMGAGSLDPTASEVCITATRMLDAVGVEVFELAMFKTWSAIAGGDAQER